jgi:hypothetical protein
LGQLDAYQQRFKPAYQEKDEGTEQIQDADPFVITGHDPREQATSPDLLALGYFLCLCCHHFLSLLFKMREVCNYLVDFLGCEINYHVITRFHRLWILKPAPQVRFVQIKGATGESGSREQVG